MKKQVIAVAVAAAIAAPAMAQNVSIYGIVDQSFSTFDNGSTNINRSLSSLLSSGRLGFTGTEDLGGGMKAIYVVENSLAGDTGAVGAGDRQLNVQLQGAFGNVTIGRVSHRATDVDVSTSRAGNLGTTLTDRTTDAGVKLDALGDKRAASVVWTSPAINGFQAQVGYAANDANDKTEGYDLLTTLHLQYSAGPLTAQIAQATNEASATVNNKQTSFGIRYDLGMIDIGLAAGSYDPSSAAAGDKYSWNILSAAVPMGNGLTLHGVLNTAKQDNTAGNEKATATTVAVTKAMSKRTTVYAGYQSVDNKPNAAFTHTSTGFTTATSSALTAGNDLSAAFVGVRHTF